MFVFLLVFVFSCFRFWVNFCSPPLGSTPPFLSCSVSLLPLSLLPVLLLHAFSPSPFSARSFQIPFFRHALENPDPDSPPLFRPRQFQLPFLSSTNSPPSVSMQDVPFSRFSFFHFSFDISPLLSACSTYPKVRISISCEFASPQVLWKMQIVSSSVEFSLARVRFNVLGKENCVVRSIPNSTAVQMHYRRILAFSCWEKGPRFCVEVFF